MQSVEDWAEIRRLHFSERVSVRAISKRLGIHRKTVRRALHTTSPPTYNRPAVPSKLDPFKPHIHSLLKDHVDMPATTIAERVGYEGSLTILRDFLRDFLREVRPLYAPEDSIQRTTYRPGELAQWDFWIPSVDIPVGHGHVARLPVWLGVSGYSRWATGLMVPSRRVHDLLAGHLFGLNELGGVPHVGVYDNESAIVASRRRGEVGFTQEFLLSAAPCASSRSRSSPCFPRARASSSASSAISKELPAGA